MADKITTGNIYTDPVGNNLVVVDPNKVVIDGKVKDRLVAHEDLIMYVNLTAKIFPRSKIISGIGDSDKVVIDIFDGDLNFLKPKGGNKLNSDWTEGFTNPDINKKLINEDDEVIGTQNPKDIQGFGITSISIKVDSSYIPSVQINFTDVRGKTLFEQARTNTPYTAFFHLPYPTFFLVVKGYYGKAVRYQLTLTKFVSRFDPASGDYLVTCDFIGNHIALLRDINMHHSLTAPYMFPSQASPDGSKVTATKGMDVLGEVYSLYAKKGLIDEDFPRDMTVVSLLDILNKLENDLGRLFGEANLAATTDKLQYGEDLENFRKELYLDTKTSWKRTYLSMSGKKNIIIVVPSETIASGKTHTVSAYPLKNMPTDASKPDYHKNRATLQSNASQGLDKIISKYNKLFSENPTFGGGGKYKVELKFPTNTAKQPGLALAQSMVNGPNGPTIKDISKLDSSKGDYFIIDAYEKSIMMLWKSQKKEFDGGPDSQAKQMATEITDVLNNRLEQEIGFRPTIRNVFAVIMSGADTFLRLLDDVHTKAMKNSKNEKRLSVSKESKDTKETDIVFPWPQYYVTKQEKECCTSSVITYLGAEDAIDTTEGNNKEIWPEVDFVEEYTKASIYKTADFKFNAATSSGFRQYTPITVRDWTGGTPYTDYNTYSDLLFEILNRAQEAVRYGSLGTRFITTTSTLIGESFNELSKYDAANLYAVIKDFSNLKELFSKINNIDELKDVLVKSDASTYLLYSLEDVVLPKYVKATYEYSYVGQPYTILSEDFPKNVEALKLDKQAAGLFDLAPTRYGNWVRQNFAGAYTASSTDFYMINKNLEYNVNETDVLRDTPDTHYYTDSMYCTAGASLETEEVKRLSERYRKMFELMDKTLVDSYYNSIITNKLLITEGILKSATVTTGTGNAGDPVVTTEGNERITSMLNTPYFINSLLKGVVNEQSGVKEAYKESAYLFLNSLPLPTFRERVLVGDGSAGEDFGAYMSELFNQIPALHDIPVSLLMRVGSIWWRYKQTVRGAPDPLVSVWGDIGGGPANVYDAAGQDITKVYDYTDNWGVQRDFMAQLSANTTASTPVLENMMNVGVYPTIIEAIHYITTGIQIVPFALQSLNNIIDAGAGTAPLTIKVNSQIAVVKDKDTSPLPSGTTTVNFYDVWMDSQNITDENLGVKFTNQEKPSRYYILYPSSGALSYTDVGGQPDTTVLFNNNAIHNGASRLIWELPNYGYIQNKPSYLPPANSYIKKINPSASTQDSWRFSQDSDYSTIEELRGVFNTEQLDFFEDLFLSFSNQSGATETSIGSTETFKKIMKDIMVVEESWLLPNEIAMGLNQPINLSIAQSKKFFSVLHKFIYSKITYAHRSTTDLDTVVNNATLMQRLRAIRNDSKEYDFGKYSASTTTIPSAGNVFVGNPVEYQDMRIYVGEYYSQGGPQFNNLVPADDSNKMYNFFKTATIGGPKGAGIEFNSENIKAFAPIIRLYGSNPTPVGVYTAYGFIGAFLDGFDNTLKPIEELYVNNLIKNLNSKITQGQKVKKSTNEDDFIDNRTSVEGDDIKLELYNQFKYINDRWISGIRLTDNTLFEKFLFFDRGNRDIGDDAIINIWDILKLDSPFAVGNDKTLTQSVDSFINTILANNGFNFIALPSYINFYQVGGDNAQVQGNSMFGTFNTVDYLESAPAFLCQYIGKKSDQLDVKTPK